MAMPWFLPVSLVVGSLVTRETWVMRRTQVEHASRGAMLMLLVVGWAPFLIWVVQNLWPQP